MCSQAGVYDYTLYSEEPLYVHPLCPELSGEKTPHLLVDLYLPWAGSFLFMWRKF